MKLISYLNHIYGEYNKILLDSDQKTFHETLVPVEWNELAFKANCNYCGEEIIFSNENKVKNGRYSCENPSCPGNEKNDGFVEPKNCKRTGYVYLYSVVKTLDKKERLFIEFDEKYE